MSGPRKLATIECPRCSAVVAVYRSCAPGDAFIGWTSRDDTLCEMPPIAGSVRPIRTEVERAFATDLSRKLEGR